MQQLALMIKLSLAEVDLCASTLVEYGPVDVLDIDTVQPRLRQFFCVLQLPDSISVDQKMVRVPRLLPPAHLLLTLEFHLLFVECS